jgi:hypothetical protein
MMLLVLSAQETWGTANAKAHNMTSSAADRWRRLFNGSSPNSYRTAPPKGQQNIDAPVTPAQISQVSKKARFILGIPDAINRAGTPKMKRAAVAFLMIAGTET